MLAKVKKAFLHPATPITIGTILILTATSTLSFVCGLIVIAVGVSDIIAAKR